MRTNLNRRLQALEATRPTQEDEEKARGHARARMIVEDPAACDLAHELLELTVAGDRAELVTTRLEARLRILEIGRA